MMLRGQRVRRGILTVLLLLWPGNQSRRINLLWSDPLPVAPAIATEPLAIVVNRTNPVDDLTFTELRHIFLGSRSYWSNGRRITLVMREPGDSERKTVLRDICTMNEDQFKNHFLHGLYTGEILVSPKILSSPVGMRKFVFNVPGAIGYLRVGDIDDTVKVIRIDELLPGDAGYRLRVASEN